MQANSFDSNEELYFSWYLKELLDSDIIISWDYHPKPFILSERVVRTYDLMMKRKGLVSKDSFILNPHQYQADFHIRWNPKWINKIFLNITGREYGKNCIFFANGKNNFSVIDCKGTFAQPHNNSAVTFPLNQKWVWQKYSIYVQKIIPIHLFKNSFTPHRFLLTDNSGKARKIAFETRNILYYLNKIDND